MRASSFLPPRHQISADNPASAIGAAVTEVIQQNGPVRILSVLPIAKGGTNYAVEVHFARFESRLMPWEVKVYHTYDQETPDDFAGLQRQLRELEQRVARIGRIDTGMFGGNMPNRFWRGNDVVALCSRARECC